MSIDHEEIHIEAKRCADLIGVTPYSDMRPFVERAVIVALSSERQRQAEVMEEVRKAALEEAAKIADDHAKSECSGMGSETEAMRLGARSIAAAIRALSDSSPTLLQEQNANGGKEGE